MKIVFVGASKFGLRCLDLMVNMPACSIVGAITVPQKFPISYRPQGVTNVLYADVKSYCKTQDIDCLVMNKGMKDPMLFKWVNDRVPDLFIVVGWYHMIPASWRKRAPVYGLHASLLPDYSGGAPLVWAMINGEPRTGITFFQFSAGVDNGPIVGQLATDIHPQDTIATLYDRIEGLGFELLRVYLPKLADGSVELISQDDSKRRLFPQRSPEDGKIDWSQLAQHTHNFIRAQTKPYPGAFTLLGEDKITVWASRLTDRVCDLLLSPGELGATGDRVFVGCGGGTVIEITHIEKNGIEVPVHVWYCGLKKSGGVYVFQYSTAQR